MKLFRTILLCSLALAFNVRNSRAWTISGFVFCDANQNEQIDTGDVPVPGVLVVVTNLSGTFSNANFTTTPDGGFVLDVPSGPDSYVEYIHPLTLPGDAFGVLPGGGVYAFTLDETQTNFTGNFLISSASCTNVTPPPPPVTNNCCVVACGSFGPKKGKPLYTFAGSVLPACGCTNGDSGVWEVIAQCSKLHFQGCQFEIVNCGDETSSTSSCAIHFIEFQGTGILKGIAGCKANFGLVYFHARAEDHGDRGDSLYFRAFDADGNTLLLISSDSTDATDVAPLPICDGKIVVGHDCCDIGTGGHGNGGEGDHNGGKDQGKGNGKGHGKGDNKGNGKGDGKGDCKDGGKGNGKGNDNSNNGKGKGKG
jgi:hypothetical protein